MNQDQQWVSWVAIIGLFIGIWLAYRPTLSAIIFGTPANMNGSQLGPPVPKGSTYIPVPL